MKRILCIAAIMIAVCAMLGGCRVSKNEGGDKTSDTSRAGEVVKVTNGQMDLEQATKVFCGMKLSDIMKHNEDGKDSKDNILYRKGRIRLSYSKKSKEGLGPIFIYQDMYMDAGNIYNCIIKGMFGAVDDVVDCRMRQMVPYEEFQDCSKEHILAVCNPCAYTLGYTEENSKVDCYAVSSEMLKKAGKEMGYSGPIKEIKTYEDSAKYSDNELSALAKKNPWRDTDRAVYVVYRPIINGKEMSSANGDLHMIYQPDLDKVIYAEGLTPWKTVSVEKKDGMISEKEAIASAKAIKQVRSDDDVEILKTEVIYSQDFSVMRKNWTLSLCYRVDMKLLNSKENQGNQAYCTVFVDAFSGERVQMWPE